LFVIFCIFVGFLAVMSAIGEQNQEETEDWSLLPASEADVSLSSLLEEMTDRGALARWPEHSWAHGHRSSTQRPVDEPGGWGWHRNDDFGQYVGMTVREQGRMHILLDVDGPGVITRIWSANPEAIGNIVVYVDDMALPSINEPMSEYLSGEGTVPSPFADQRGSGLTSYLPIPYGDNIVIAVTEGSGSRLYYGIDYRTYPEGTKVQSFVGELLDEHADEIASVGERLSSPVDPKFEPSEDREDRWTWKSTSPGALSGIRLRFDEGTDPTGLELSIVLDGAESVNVRVGDFFGCGLGVHPFEDWDRTVTDTSMTSRWVIPFERSAQVQIRGEPSEDVQLEVATIPWQWDDRSLRFGASNRTQRGIPTRPFSDWPVARIEGRGFYVADTLRVVNPVDAWWGAGDERFWVDGVLAQVGTGTEDYYGYAYCSNEVFSGPFGGQPRNDQKAGPADCGNSAGHVTNTRVRLLDRVLFEGLMVFELEIWHHEETTLDYAATAFWYTL